ncbi:glycosyltransferase [Falsirhodobacter halotolerans]|uniref:glycosyltransferase n=1 Tax=Falsirhodobacter halotolerans TaxID=1146892 RepID=UPI001FD1E1DE|nr:glycosyltransferase [Falsirhodobacter halotolerans]MCJ8140496.1 glycosyltransferase [Falsirhodobacter halotolerans]
MKILFLHQNFPGQFLHLAPALKARGHDCLALTVEGNTRPSDIRTLRYRFSPSDRDGIGLAGDYARMTDRGLAVARAAYRLRADGYVPDVILGHSGWGETLFLKDIWPEARLLIYAEFFYRGQGQDTGFDPEFSAVGPDAGVRAQARGAHLSQALVHADAGISPTQWQADSHPATLRPMIRVIHDGVDTARMAPDPHAQVAVPNGPTLRAGDEVLTFVNRNLEPYRGYHIFLRALPDVLAARPRAQVVIVGGDGVSYGRAPPEGSWKDRFLTEMGDRLDRSRVHFLGNVPYGVFRSLMQVTRVHAYLTYPFVLSWSMLEAMSAGALVVGSDTPPVREVIRHGTNGLLVDFFDVAGWSAALTGALADPARHDGVRAAGRQTILDRYDLRAHCLPRMIAFVENRA